MLPKAGGRGLLLPVAALLAIILDSAWVSFVTAVKGQ